MAANHTPNYQLSQWKASDPVVRADFNADNAKIDAALAALEASKAEASALDGKADKSALTSLATKAEVSSVQGTVPKFAAGSYTGDGTASRTVSLGFTPKAVYVCTPEGHTVDALSSNSYTYHCGGLALTGRVCSCSGGTVVSVQSGGFKVYLNTSKSVQPYTNVSGKTYHYLAIG